MIVTPLLCCGTMNYDKINLFFVNIFGFGDMIVMCGKFLYGFMLALDL